MDSMGSTERSRIGPIDLSVLDSRKGPQPARNSGPSSSVGPMTTKNTSNTGGFFGKTFGGASEMETKMTSERNRNDPMHADDGELGIDRS